MTSKKSTSKPPRQSTSSKQSTSKVKTSSKKKSGQSSTKPTSPAKKLSKDSIYNLDSWKWNYEDVTKPKNKVVVSLKKRIKHAWAVLRG